METLVKKKENFQKRKNGFEPLSGNISATESHTDSSAESRGSSISSRSSLEASTEDMKVKGSSSPAPLGWPIRKAHVSEDKQKSHEEKSSKFGKIGSKILG